MEEQSVKDATASSGAEKVTQRKVTMKLTARQIATVLALRFILMNA